MTDMTDGFARVTLNEQQREAIVRKWNTVDNWCKRFKIDDHIDSISVPKCFGGTKDVKIVRWAEIDSRLESNSIRDYFYVHEFMGDPCWGTTKRGTALENLALLCKSSGELYVTPMQSEILFKELGSL